MSAGLPCPNPTCTYSFPREAVKGSASLKCPRCGAVFHFGGQPAKAPRPAPAPPPPPPKSSALPSWLAASLPDEAPARPKPRPKAETPPPVAKRVVSPPVPIDPPRAPAEPPASTGLTLDGTENIISASRIRQNLSKRNSPVRTVIVVGSLGLIVAALVVGGVLMALNGGGDGSSIKSDATTIVMNGMVYNQRKQTEEAFRLVVPRDAWNGNEARKKALKAVVSLDRADGMAWLAVAAQDYGTRKPRDSELLLGALERLENCFGENLEVAAKPEPRELAGESAEALQFRGANGSVTWSGECYILSKNGMGYWLFIAGAPALKDAQDALADLQAERGHGFVLSTARRGWTEQPAKMVSFAGTKGNFRLKGPEEIWESLRAGDLDERAELYLLGRDQRERKDNLRSATVLVLPLTMAADLKSAMNAAREQYLTARQAENKEYKLEPAGESGSVDGSQIDVGSLHAQVAELRLANAASPYKYVVLAVVQEGGRAYVIQCEAHWGNHQVWRSEFLDLIGTFRLTGS